MLRQLLIIFLLIGLCGCNAGTFQVSKQDYQAEVQVLGIVPLLIDQNAPLNYPFRAPLYDLLTRSNVNKHELLVAQLRKKKGYFDVRPLSGDAGLLALSLLAGETERGRLGRPQGYLFDKQAVAELARQNAVDALLVIVFSGAQVEEARRSRTLFESLKTRYNDVLATAAVVSHDGQILWQLAGEESYQALMLQYADFDEAYYNRTDVVQVKNISLSGVEKVLDETADTDGKQQIPQLYTNLFKRIASAISPGLLDSLR